MNDPTPHLDSRGDANNSGKNKGSSASFMMGVAAGVLLTVACIGFFIAAVCGVSF